MRQDHVWGQRADQPDIQVTVLLNMFSLALLLMQLVLMAPVLMGTPVFAADAHTGAGATPQGVNGKPVVANLPAMANDKPSAAETKPLVMRIATMREISPNHEIVDLLQAAYARLGYRMELVQLPAARSVREVADGFLDGELARAESPLLQQASLIRVPAPVAEISASAFVRDRDLPIRDYASLLPYQVDTLFGLPLLEQRLAQHRVEKVGTMEQALRRVASGRTQVAVLPTSEGREVLARLALTGVSVVEPPLETVALHHYLNVRHRALAEPLARAITELRAGSRPIPP